MKVKINKTCYDAIESALRAEVRSAANVVYNSLESHALWQRFPFTRYEGFERANKRYKKAYKNYIRFIEEVDYPFLTKDEE